MTETITGLRQTEAWFWQSEPRLVIALIDEHKRIERERMKTQAYYTACFVWGKTPDEIDEDTGIKKPIPGIDIPATPEMLRGFV